MLEAKKTRRHNSAKEDALEEVLKEKTKRLNVDMGLFAYPLQKVYSKNYPFQFCLTLINS